MRYPISVQSFSTLREGNYVYIDKTDLVYSLAQEHVCFLSRPRRFGKSLLISTLQAYFEGKRELFTGLKMAQLEKDWTKYPVFHLDFSTGNFSGNEADLNAFLLSYLTEWEQKYGKLTDCEIIGRRFQYVLEQAYRKTGKKAVVLIDEYDKPLLDVLGEDR